MATTAKASIIINAPLEEVWKEVRDFSFPGRCISTVEDVSIEDDKSPIEVGAVRKLTWSSDQYTRDRLLVVDDMTYTLTWELIESKPDSEVYAQISTISLHRVTETKQTYIEWSSQFSAGVDASMIRFQTSALLKNLQDIRKYIAGDEAAGKILFILTNYGKKLKEEGKPTGWYLPEVAHPYYAFRKAGYKIDFISPKGGDAPVDVGSVSSFKDAASQAFFRNLCTGYVLPGTKKPSDVKSSDYKCVFFPGGHGPMFDLADNKETGALAAEAYENGGVVGALCHGPAGLVPVTLKDGTPLVKGKNLCSFSNKEEELANLTKEMPFLLETKLVELGATFKAGDPWKENVVVDGRLVTGANPASAHKTGTEILKLLAK